LQDEEIAIMDKHGSISSLYGKDVLVYGMGSIAKILLPYLYAMPKMHLVGIALTNVEGECKYRNTSLKVCNIQQWAQECPQVTVLIATSDRYHAEIANICYEQGFQDIVPITPALKESITCTFFELYLQEKGVDLSKPYIQLGKAEYLNPLKSDWNNSVNIFNQLADLVFPHLFPDWTLLDEGPYDPDGILDLPSNSVVLDCGANFGTFSVYAASKGCRCYAFEPTPELLPVLQKYAERSQDRIIPVPCAVSDKDGVSTFHLSTYSCGANSLLDRVNSEKNIEVQTVKIDSFVEKHGLPTVDFIKADIEGAERMMLDGARETLARFAPRLSLCTYHLSDDKEALAARILSANPNYKIEYHWEKLYAYVPGHSL